VLREVVEAENAVVGAAIFGTGLPLYQWLCAHVRTLAREGWQNRTVIALVFSYEVRNATEFERVYGPAGEWADFFRRGTGYVGTELLRDVETPSRYLVVDRWDSAEAYNAFVSEYRDEYMRRVDDTRFHYDSELRFGTFEAV
jgi:heme-degrading monooxygenase HmoA